MHQIRFPASVRSFVSQMDFDIIQAIHCHSRRLAESAFVISVTQPICQFTTFKNIPTSDNYECTFQKVLCGNIFCRQSSSQSELSVTDTTALVLQYFIFRVEYFLFQTVYSFIVYLIMYVLIQPLSATRNYCVFGASGFESSRIGEKREQRPDRARVAVLRKRRRTNHHRISRRLHYSIRF